MPKSGGETLAWDRRDRPAHERHQPETVASRQEHAARRQAFLDARDELVARYDRAVAGPTYQGFDKHTPWQRLVGWAFGHDSSLLLAQLGSAAKKDPEAVHELSDLALGVLLAHRQLALTFNCLPEDDQKALRPKTMEASWKEKYGPGFKKVALDTSRLVEGDAAARQLARLFPRGEVLDHDSRLYSGEVQQLIRIRSEALREPARSLLAALNTWSEDGLDDRVYHCDLAYRRLAGQARDNGDWALWLAAARHLNPQIISGRVADVEFGLYISDRTHPGERAF